MESTFGEAGNLSYHLFTQEKAGCGEDLLMPLATTSIWSIEIKVYMVKVSQNLSFRGVGNIQLTIDQFILHDLNGDKSKEIVLSFQTLFLN